jgi:hypothetical protein
MVDPSEFFKHGRVPCPKCGQINDLGSSEAPYRASLATPYIHSGFLFLDHIDRQMKKLREMTAKHPEWGELMRSGRNDVIKQRLDELVPLPKEARTAVKMNHANVRDHEGNVGDTAAQPRRCAVIRDKTQGGRAAMFEWVSGWFDPEDFDPVTATKSMKKGLPVWRNRM